jgi:type IV pilus assembly protein PilP
MKASGVALFVYSGILFFATVSPVAAGKPSAQVETTPPVAAAPPSYHYNPRGKADPFKPFMETDLAVIKKKSEAMKSKQALSAPKAISPLQQKDIGQFFLVGIAGDQHRRTAIVEDKAAKKHYPLYVGTSIGKNQGRVAQILTDKVIVEEMIRDDQQKTKKTQVKRIEMFLHKYQ